MDTKKKQTRTSWNQSLSRKAKTLRRNGYTNVQIAKTLNVSAPTITKYSRQENWQVGSLKLDQKTKELAEKHAVQEIKAIVRERLEKDLGNSLDALDTHHPVDCNTLSDLLTRERIAESVQKRASSLLGLEEQSKTVVNIAILSSLPDVSS